MFGLPIAHWLVIVSAFISVCGAYPYVRDTLAGKTKPNRVSWSMWAFAPMIGTFAALSIGADPWATVRIFLGGFVPLIILIASFVNPQSYWKLSVFDLLCGALSLVALIVWGAIDSPRLAILIAATGDGFASIPTLVKAWKYPETETGSVFIASFVAVAIVMPSIPVWNIENSAFQIYLFLVNLMLIFAVYRKRLGIGA